MSIIDNFDLAVEQFLKHRINSLLYEIDSISEKDDLSQTIYKLLDQCNLALNPQVLNNLSEVILDLILEYQENITRKIYVKAFSDGLKFESKFWEE